MTDNIKKSVKQRSKLTKIFYKNGQRNSDYIKVLEKSEGCTSLIAEAKKNNILKMTYNLEDSNTASETYCPILNRFLYNKNTLQYHLYLLMVISFQIFAKKSTFLISFFLLYAHLEKVKADYLLSSMKQTTEFIAFVLRIRIYYQ